MAPFEQVCVAEGSCGLYKERHHPLASKQLTLRNLPLAVPSPLLSRTCIVVRAHSDIVRGKEENMGIHSLM